MECFLKGRGSTISKQWSEKDIKECLPGNSRAFLVILDDYMLKGDGKEETRRLIHPAPP